MDSTTPDGVIDLGGGVVMTAAQGELATALAAAQGQVRSAERNARNPHLRNRYADLESVIRAVRSAFADHGLSVSMHPIADGRAAGVRYVLSHASGQWRSGVLLHETSGKGLNAAQRDGVCISYARRYCLMSLAAISAGDDVDGSTAHAAAPASSGRAYPAPPSAAAPPPPVDTKGTAWRGWQAGLKDHALDYTTVAAWCEGFGKPRPSAMDVAQWDRLRAWIDDGGAARIRAWAGTDPGKAYLKLNAERRAAAKGDA